MSLDTLAFAGGFQEPVFEAQAAFRTLMDCMARPGTIGAVAATVTPPATSPTHTDQCRSPRLRAYTPSASATSEKEIEAMGRSCELDAVTSPSSPDGTVRLNRSGQTSATSETMPKPNEDHAGSGWRGAGYFHAIPAGVRPLALALRRLPCYPERSARNAPGSLVKGGER